MLALKWDDVDLEGGVLRVRRTITKAGRVYTIGGPKTKHGRRVLRLTVPLWMHSGATSPAS